MFGTVDVLVIQRNFYVVLLIISLRAENASKGDCGSFASNTNRCCANYYLVNGVCTVCQAGYFGIDCKVKCASKSYGVLCGSTCINCEEHECHHVTGCPSKGSTGILEALTSLSLSTERNAFIKQTTTKQTIKSTLTAGDENFQRDVSSPAIIITQNESTISLAIIITGSVLSIFLLIIIINQIHGKLKKRTTHTVTKDDQQISSHMDQAYMEINEITMSANTFSDNEIKNLTSTERVEKERMKYEQIKEHSNSNNQYQDIHAPYLSPLLSSRPPCVLPRSPEMNNRSDYIDAIDNKTIGTPDKNTYLQPIGKKNMYLQVIDAIPSDDNYSPQTATNEYEEFPESEDTSAQMESTRDKIENNDLIRDTTYLDVVHLEK